MNLLVKELYFFMIQMRMGSILTLVPLMSGQGFFFVATFTSGLLIRSTYLNIKILYYIFLQSCFVTMPVVKSTIKL